MRKLIANLTVVIKPLVSLTHEEIAKNVKPVKHWEVEQDRVFSEVNQLLASAPLLRFPDFSKGFVKHDARDSGAGAFLAQQNDAGELAL